MVIRGRVQNGVVMIEGKAALPEGATVAITYPAPTKHKPPAGRKRIEVSLVRTGEPGTVHLTGARIAEILDHEDGSPRH